MLKYFWYFIHCDADAVTLVFSEICRGAVFHVELRPCKSLPEETILDIQAVLLWPNT